MSFSLIIKTGLSYWKKHPSQFILALLGIMLGVGVVTAIDLTNTSALKSFQHSVTTVSGKTTHRLISASGTIPEEDYFFCAANLESKIRLLSLKDISKPLERSPNLFGSWE